MKRRENETTNQSRKRSSFNMANLLSGGGNYSFTGNYYKKEGFDPDSQNKYPESFSPFKWQKLGLILKPTYPKKLKI